jgi:type I restriction enzyme, S subunit
MTGWEKKSLGDVCEILDSKRRPVTKKDRRTGEYPYYGATGIVDYVDEFIFDEPLVLVGEDGAKWGSGEGTAFSVSERCWVNNHAHVLRPIRARLLDDWLVYYLVHQDLSPFVSGLTVPKLNQGNLREIPVPLPPVAEQRRIVAILDEGFDAIATAKVNTEKNLRNAGALFELQRDSVFSVGQKTWPSQRLGAVADVQSGGTPLISKKEFWGGSIAWYSSGELNDIETQMPNRFITEAGLAGSNAKLLPKGSLLVGMYDTAALKMSILDRTAAFNQAIAGVKPNARLETEFVFHAINFQKPELLSLRRGVRQKNLSLAKIKEIVVPVPTVPVQRRVIEHLSSARELSDRLESVYHRKMRAFDELKSSLLAQAFTGALTARAIDTQVAEIV